ncbi:MAG: hypothetical protein EZS28_012946 [Streblomastix strix]|uniref:Uncharacterized protein n=1 Tax=Streblomastix strix TaxID=222440 RepID=A0A5J4W9D2_9EUKA|nr:MAG: hypothetical protein EZS28_012946 [Streblomastix strix]
MMYCKVAMRQLQRIYAENQVAISAMFDRAKVLHKENDYKRDLFFNFDEKPFRLSSVHFLYLFTVGDHDLSSLVQPPSEKNASFVP